MSIESMIGKVSERVGNVKASAWAKVDELSATLDNQAQHQFVQKVAADEGVSYEDAIAMCTPHSDLWQPKYSMGYKMQSPAMTIAMATKKGRKAFRDSLLPEELECYKEIETTNFGKLITEEYRSQKKKEKEAKKAAKKRAAGLEIKSAKKKS